MPRYFYSQPGHEFNRLVTQLRDKRRLLGLLQGKIVNVNVLYKAFYAVFVHENLAVPHRSGQAKFLETAIRANLNNIQAIIRVSMQHGMSLRDALKQAGDFILQESNKLVPVDTGFLRDSGEVEVK